METCTRSRKPGTPIKQHGNSMVATNTKRTVSRRPKKHGTAAPVHKGRLPARCQAPRACSMTSYVHTPAVGALKKRPRDSRSVDDAKAGAAAWSHLY